MKLLNLSILSLLVIIGSVNFLRTADAACCLCNNAGCGKVPSTRSRVKANNRGKTCSKIAHQVKNRSGSQCSKFQRRFKSRCCGLSGGSTINIGRGSSSIISKINKNKNSIVTKKKNGHVNVNIGNSISNNSVTKKCPNPGNTKCNLCKNGGTPRNRNVVTAVLYVPGNPKCIDLYDMGKRGCLPGHICEAMQYYMKSPCGC